MLRIREEDIQAIRARADIADIISHYIDVSKKGRNYQAVCPFHDDHDPSLSISSDKQIFKCFVCGTGGNVFTFVQKYENIPFVQAVYKVADLIGYPLDRPKQFDQEKADPFKKEHAILEEFTNYCHYELNSQEGVAAKEYLRSRQFSDSILEKFRLGYAPSQKSISYFFKAKHFEPSILEKVGLVNENRIVFSERIMIPLEDRDGKIVGYSARILPDQTDRPKYINTAQTPLYEKGQLIFNYHRVKATCRKADRVILCEGAMDVFGLEKAGISEGIACLGTAITPYQIQLIKALKVPVRVWYDNDAAGKKATYTFGKMACEASIPFTIIKNDKGKDPDEVFNTYGAKEVEQIVNSTIPFIEFLFSFLPSQYNLNNYEEKKQYAQELKAMIELLNDPIEQAMFYSRLKEQTGFDFYTQSKSDQRPRNRQKGKRDRILYIPDLEAGRVRAERFALFTMLHSKSNSLRFKEEVGYFKDADHRRLSLYIYNYYRDKDQLDPMELIEQIEEDSVRNLLVSLLEMDVSLLNTDAFEDCLWKIKESSISEQIERLNQQIALILDPLQKVDLAMKKKQLIEQRNIIRNRKEG